jgi:hypothetical protein
MTSFWSGDSKAWAESGVSKLVLGHEGESCIFKFPQAGSLCHWIKKGRTLGPPCCFGRQYPPYNLKGIVDTGVSHRTESLFH